MKKNNKIEKYKELDWANKDKVFVWCKECHNDTDWYWEKEKKEIEDSLCKTCRLKKEINEKENLIQTSNKKCNHDFIFTNKLVLRHEKGWGDEIKAIIKCSKCSEERKKIIQYCN